MRTSTLGIVTANNYKPHLAARTPLHKVYESSEPKEQQRYTKRPTTLCGVLARLYAVLNAPAPGHLTRYLALVLNLTLTLTHEAHVRDGDF